MPSRNVVAFGFVSPGFEIFGSESSIIMKVNGISFVVAHTIVKFAYLVDI